MESFQSLEYSPQPVRAGYTDRILRLDLGARSISLMEVPESFKRQFIGGRGYALKLIWDETTGETRYDSPENLLVMSSGPLGNEPWFPGSGKFIIGTISPLTDTFVDSNIGGHFAPLLKLAGFDALAVSGVSDREVVLIIDADQGRISLVEAPDYGEDQAGSLSYGNALLEDMFGGLSENAAAVTAGPAGIHARFGIINSLFFDKRRNRLRSKQAGRGGTGTVMRHKGLRAVLVRSGLPRLKGNQAADPDGVKRAGAGLKKVVSQCDSQQLYLGAWGTTGLTEYMNKFHILPIDNYQYGQSPKSEAVFAEVFRDKYFSKKLPDGCYIGCNLACAKAAENVLLTRGPHAGRRVGVDGPEYETVGAVTAMGIFDPQFILEYNYYCDEYGLDTISTGVSIAFLMECAQRGMLTAEDVGYDLRFGDAEAADRLLHEVAQGEGFGRVCGQGVSRAKGWVAERYASKNGASPAEALAELSKFGMEVKGLEFSMYISKESLAQQGGYGFALKGPQHDEAWLIFIDQVHKELPTYDLKAKALKWFPLIRTWFNAVGLCKLPWIDVRHPEAANTDWPAQNQPSLKLYVDYFNATVGANKTLQDILDDSERLGLLQKMINLRHGQGTRASDQIPWRAMGPAYLNEYEVRSDYYDEWLREKLGPEASLPADPAARHALLMDMRRKEYDELCDTVYRAKGFDDIGVPLPSTLEKFGLLDEQAHDLLDRNWA
ncbi:MAG: aldehyde:ferredoxin oxidoreductase [Proteobacteria bacterium]|nr:aldehyde:ferredoxin oxidoreductase [Pseudomonadota bacterium]